MTKKRTSDLSGLDTGVRARLIAAAVAAWPADSRHPLRCPVDSAHPPVVVVLDDTRRVGFRCRTCEFRWTAGELAHVLQSASGRWPRIGE